jgi:hypothetical protein
LFISLYILIWQKKRTKAATITIFAQGCLVLGSPHQCEEVEVKVLDRTTTVSPKSAELGS